jgi:hypothetical protein
MKDILQEQIIFYQNLYELNVEDNNQTQEIYNTFFKKEDYVKTLTNEQALSIEEDINTLECYEVLRNMNKQKSPGSDGFTA